MRPEGGPAPTSRRQLRRFILWLLAAVLVFVAAVAAANWWFDPVGVTGRQTRFVAVENSGVRMVKADLMEQRVKAPKVLVLGSSRSMKLDPRDIRQVTGDTAFNAAVSGGTTRDMYLYAKYAEKVWGGKQYPHLVIGVISDTFRDGMGGGATADPRLRALLLPEDQTTSKREIASTLVQMETLKATVRMAIRIAQREGIASLAHPETSQPAAKPKPKPQTPQARTPRRSNAPESFANDGMQLYPPVDPTTAPLAVRVGAQIRDYNRRQFERPGDTFDGMDPGARDMFVRMIRLANSHGDTPAVWITPYQPAAQNVLPVDEFGRRDRAFRDELHSIGKAEHIRFTVADFAKIGSFGGVAEGFYDGIHMMPSNTKRVIEELHRRGEM